MIDHETRSLLTRPMQKSLDDFEKRTVPTLLEVKTGMPSSIEGKTDAARSLKAFANGIKAKLNDVAKTHFRVSADATLTDALKLTRSATYANSRINEARNHLSMIADDASFEFDALSSRIKDTLKAPSSAGQAAIDSELRTWVKNLKPLEAKQAIQDNPDLLAAVVRAPNVLSGISTETYDSLKAEYLQRMIPDDYAKYADLQEAVKAANMALSLLENESAALIDFETAAKFEKQRYTA